MKPELSRKDSARIDAEATSIQDGDLYRALKHVGDDPTKSAIEATLKEMLDQETFKRVVAVFVIATSDE